MPRLQLLVATMNLTDIIGLCDEMHIASDALIINQADSVKYEYVFYHGYKIECYTFAERGLSRSRNNALLRCTGDILCIADDDMVYTDTYREDIINAFQKHPEADALVFNVTALNDERSGKPIEKYARVGKRESREYGSVHIAMFIVKQRLKFISASRMNCTASQKNLWNIEHIMEMRWQRNEMGQLYKVDFQQDRRRKSIQYDCGTE